MYAQWEELDTTTFWRHHAIGFSHNNFGYVLSGGNIFGTSTLFKYDPTNDSYEQLEDYPGPPRGFGMGTQYNGKGYFGFGMNGNGGDLLNDLWEFDFETLTFTELPSCPCVIRNHPAFIAHNGKIYAGMGDDAIGDLNDWWAYDIGTQEWEQKNNIPGKRHHPFFFSIGKFIYVGGGHDENWYKYDENNDQWTGITKLDDRVAGTQFSYNGKGYVLSGTNDLHQNFTTGEFWEYDPIEDSWTELPPHPGSSKWAPASFIIDNYVYIVTGTADESDYTAYRYHLGESTPVSEVNHQNNLEVFPNPFLDKVFINHESNALADFLNIKLTDITGKIVYTSNKLENEIDLKHLSNGPYILTITSGNNIFSEMILKTNSK